jgi:methionyl-tRNA synthetase
MKKHLFHFLGKKKKKLQIQKHKVPSFYKKKKSLLTKKPLFIFSSKTKKNQKMLPFELISDAANHHALKSLIVAFKNKTSLKVTLVKRSSSSPATAVLPYLVGASLPSPIFAPNEIAKLVAQKATANKNDDEPSSLDLFAEQWLNWEADKLSTALAPLYNQRRFTPEARSALKHLESSYTSAAVSSPLSDAIVYSSIFPAFCKDGILKEKDRAEFAGLTAWFAKFEQENRPIIDAASIELGAAEPADFLRVRPSYALTPANKDRPFYVTTPIYYVNASPHIGHVYTTLIADTLARYHKLKGEQTKFLTGTDEHGQKVAQAAAALGKTPKQFTDDVSATFRSCFQQFGFDFDHFIRTTDPIHERHVQELWQKLVASGDIILGSYEGWYCVSDENYLTEQNVVDGIDKATGQPAKCCADCGRPVVRLREDNYVFKLSKYQNQLLKYYRENPKCITPEFRRQEVIRFVEGGLLDLSVSRQRKSCEWGIPVPGAENEHVIYVWLDALSNYLTYARLNEKDPENGPLRPWDESKLWPVDVHVIGKDILKFHAVYWPAFLFALGIPPPQSMVAHGWWTKDGQKISKATGNTFDPVEKSKEFGNDALKFFLLKESSVSDDPDYSDANMVSRNNSELADTLGNLHLRCISDKINPDRVWPTPNEYNDRDKELIEHLNDVAGVVDHYFLTLHIQKALDAVFAALRDLNGYATENEPWKLVKTDKKRLDTVLYVMLEGVRICFTLLAPVLVTKAPIALDSLGVPKELRSGCDNLKFGVVPPGTKLGAMPETGYEKGLFPKFDPPKKEEDEAAANNNKPKKNPKGDKNKNKTEGAASQPAASS